MKEEENKEKQVLIVDFSKVSVQNTFEGEPDIFDMRTGLGNAILQATGDIAVGEFARKVYFSEGAIEVPQKYVKFIKYVVQKGFNVPTQEAFESLLTL